MTRCPRCGAAASPTAKFCVECGERLAVAAAAPEVRKTVTVLFCDVVGSTALGERLDPETQRAVMNRYFATVRNVLEDHGGRVEKFIGDAVMAVFGVPASHEDDAVRAARAAAAIGEAVSTLNDELRTRYGVEIGARIGLNTGEVVVGDSAEGAIVTGDAVNLAARLQQAAAPGEVVIGEQTRRLIRDLARLDQLLPVVVKGKSAPVTAWHLVSVAPPEATLSAQRDAVLIGRRRELRLLQDAFERTTEERACCVVTVLGEPGIGKSSLISAFARDLPADTLVVSGRCLAYGESVTFFPLRQVLRDLVAWWGPPDADMIDQLRGLLPTDRWQDATVSTLAPLLGAGGAPGRPDDLQAAVRRVFEASARRQPLVVVIEDLHWAEHALLDLLQAALELSRDAPILIVVSARPELSTVWAPPVANAITVRLSGLAGDDVARLVGELLDGAPTDPDVIAAITATAGGNPLFVAQLIASLLEDGVVEVRTGVWTFANPAHRLQLPPSIKALLAARLDALPAPQRAVLDTASVVGTVFYPTAVSALMTNVAPEDAEDALVDLVRRDLVRPVASDLDDEDAYRFLHVLIRDSAYAALPKTKRAALHERFARWLGERSTVLPEVPEFIGFHLEQCHQLLAQLGPLDAHAIAIGDEAANLLTAAARRVQVADPHSTADLYDRAIACTSDPARRAKFRIRRARALYSAGELAEALACIDQASDDAAAADDAALRLTAYLEGIVIGAQFGRVVPADEIQRAVDRALSGFPADRQPDLAAAACNAKVLLYNMSATWAPVPDVLDEGARYCQRSGDGTRELFFREFMLQALVYGPTPVDEAMARWPSLLAQLPGSPDESVAAQGAWLVLVAMTDDRSRADAARERGYELLAQCGKPLTRLLFERDCGVAARILGDYDEAFGHYHVLVAGLERMGEQARLATVGAEYATEFFDRLGVAEARRLYDRALAVAADSDVSAQASVRSLKAMLLSHDGDHANAVRTAREAIVWMDRTDQTAERARMRERLATVLVAAGEPAHALSALAGAAALFDDKGDIPEARRVRERTLQVGALPAKVPHG